MLARSAKGMRLSQQQIAAMTVQRKAEWNALSRQGSFCASGDTSNYAKGGR